MYLARVPQMGGAHFVLRYSYLEDDVWLSRDLADLGGDPGCHIVYPGGNTFYPDPALVDRIQAAFACRQNVPGDVAGALENILWPYVRPDVRRAVAYFYDRSCGRKRAGTTFDPDDPQLRTLKMFDRRRILFLRSGQMDQTAIHRVPLKFFKMLLKKSRDEIEQMMIGFEDNLSQREIKTYVYTIFNLQHFFQSPMAKAFPQVLPAAEVDACFLEQLCRLNQNRDFWQGLPNGDGLRDYLKRYVIMYFDHVYPEEDFSRRYVEEFRRRYRQLRKPKTVVKASPGEYRSLFGHSRKALMNMDKRQLRGLYRKMAIRHHPDQGGQSHAFIRLTQLYRQLIAGHRRAP